MQQRIEFNLTIEDYQAFWQYAMMRHRRSRRGKWEIVACWIMGIVVIPAALIMYFTAEVQTDFIPPSVIIAIPVFFVAWVLWHRRSYARRSVRKALRSPSGKHMLNTQTIVITPERLRQSGSFGEVSLNWSTFAEIRVVEGATYFYLDAHSAIILPMHVFSNEQEYLDFTQLAQQYYDPSESPRQPCQKCGYDLRGVAELGCPECGWKREG